MQPLILSSAGERPARRGDEPAGEGIADPPQRQDSGNVHEGGELNPDPGTSPISGQPPVHPELLGVGRLVRNPDESHHPGRPALDRQHELEVVLQGTARDVQRRVSPTGEAVGLSVEHVDPPDDVRIPVLVALDIGEELVAALQRRFDVEVCGAGELFHRPAVYRLGGPTNRPVIILA